MASMISENESFQDGNGKPIVNGYIYVGVAGQDPKINPTPIYSDRNLTVPIANPQRTDAYGRSVTKIWVSDRYSLKVENVDGVQKLQDLERGEIASAQSINLINVQGINNVTADAVPAVDSYVDKAVYVLTVVSANTGAVTLDFGGGAKPVEKDNGDALVAGDWPAGSIQRVTYNAFSNRFDTLTFSTVEINNQITSINAEIDVISTKTPIQTQEVWGAGELETESVISPLKLDTKIKTLTIGDGQTWQNLIASRSFSVTYTNTTGRTIFVVVAGSGLPNNGVIRAFCDEINLGQQGVRSVASAAMRPQVSFAVPNNSTYRVENVTGASLDNWSELR